MASAEGLFALASSSSTFTGSFSLSIIFSYSRDEGTQSGFLLLLQIGICINDIIEQLRVFSFFGQMNVYDSIILTIPGANAQHPIRNTIETLFNKSGIFPTFYTIKIMKSKFIPYHELYDYDKESWKVY